MTRGITETYELAEEINRRIGRQQIDTIDIGGGLPVNFASEAATPTYEQYARLLAEAVPGLFDGRYGLVTEFGRSLLAKHGTIVARVEYTKSAGGRAIAVTHAGVQVATRTVYAPGAWPLRIAAYDGKGRVKSEWRWCRTWRGPPVSRGTCWRRGVRCRCSNRGTTPPRWTPARIALRTTTRTTLCRGPGFTGTRPGRGRCASRWSGRRRPWRRSWRRRGSREVGAAGALTRAFEFGRELWDGGYGLVVAGRTVPRTPENPWAPGSSNCSPPHAPQAPQND